MKKETIDEYYRLKSLRKASRKDVDAMQDFMKENIDPKVVICKKCSAQIRFHYQRIMNWGKANIESIERLLYDEGTETPEEVRKCACGEVITGDRRYKKCEACRLR